MKRKLALFIGFFSVVPFFLFFLILYSLYLVHENSESSKNLDLSLFRRSVAYSALPTINEQTIAKLDIEDARVAVLKEFFESYNSPLSSYSQKIVQEADLNELDYRLLAAIAMKESGLCKKIPKDSNNCWGFGIYGSKVTRFDSYNEAIQTISRTLRKKYIEEGLTIPETIMTKYTPSSKGTWAEGVNFYMDKIHTSL